MAGFIRVTSAELAKLCTLPLAVIVALGTMLVAAMTALALDASSVQDRGPVVGVEVVLQTVPFTQIGIILLGILPVAHEHSGGQYRTTFIAVPNRLILIAGKTVAAFITVAITVVLSVGASWASTVTTRHLAADSMHDVADSTQLWHLAGAVVYLVLIGMFAHTLALLMKHLIPVLVTALGLVLLAPTLAGVTEHARWLPSRAGSLLYLPSTDVMLTSATGALVLIGWITLSGTAASVVTARRDV